MHVLCSLSMTSKPQPVAVETPTQGEASYEETHVHKVYEEIASHFSETRYKVCYFSTCVALFNEKTHTLQSS